MMLRLEIAINRHCIVIQQLNLALAFITISTINQYSLENTLTYFIDNGFDIALIFIFTISGLL